jgi:hypothetical protein
MNSGEDATNWRDAVVPSRGTKSSKTKEELNKSFREEGNEEDYGNEEFDDVADPSD